MKRTIRESLEGATECLEYINGRWDDLSLEEKVDIAARAKALAKHCEKLDTSAKELISAKLKGKDGVILGQVFKAVRKWVDKRAFSQKAYKEADPDGYEKYVVDGGNYEVRYEPR